MIGKNAGKSSNDWKNHQKSFQWLEKSIAKEKTMRYTAAIVTGYNHRRNA